MKKKKPTSEPTKENSTFRSNGALYRPRGRQPLIVETQKAELFLQHLDNCDKRALQKVVKRLYDLATTSDNEVVATRCCEIILAYGIGKPTEIPHNENQNVTITFTRADPHKKSLPDSNSPIKKLD